MRNSMVDNSNCRTMHAFYLFCFYVRFEFSMRSFLITLFRLGFQLESSKTMQFTATYKPLFKIFYSSGSTLVYTHNLYA